MTYTHITMDELVFIEAYFQHGTTVAQIAKRLGRARQTIHNVITHFKAGHTAIDYYQRYKENKKRCGRKQSVLPTSQQKYIEEKVAQGWTPDVIVGRQEMPIDCSGRTLYRMFKRETFDAAKRPSCQCRTSENRMAIRNAGADKPSGVISLKEWMTIPLSMKRSATSKATPLSVSVTRVRSSRWSSACQKPSSP